MFICKCCKKEAKWCSEGSDDLEPHDCDHIHCHHCGMHYSLENKEATAIETIEELRDLMEKVYNMNEDNELGALTCTEVKIIQEYRERYMKCGDFWLTPEGRAEIRECWKDPNDGNIVLPLLNELERLEKLLSTNIQGKVETD